MKLDYYFIAFGVLLSVIYFLMTPYSIDQQKLENIAQVTFQNFKTYSIKENELQTLIEGKETKQYKKRVTLDAFIMTHDQNGTLYRIEANKGLLQNKALFLEGDVAFIEQNGLQLFTQEATYNTQYDTLDIRRQFTYEEKGAFIEGASLFFNQNNAKINANGIHATFELE